MKDKFKEEWTKVMAVEVRLKGREVARATRRAIGEEEKGRVRMKGKRRGSI